MMPPILGMSALVPDRDVAKVAMVAPDVVPSSGAHDVIQHARSQPDFRKSDYQDSRSPEMLNALEQWDANRQQAAREFQEAFTNPRRVGSMTVGDALRFRQRLNEQELSVSLVKNVADSCVQCVKTLSSGS
jgi:hypothetical protein